MLQRISEKNSNSEAHRKGKIVLVDKYLTLEEFVVLLKSKLGDFPRNRFNVQLPLKCMTS